MTRTVRLIVVLLLNLGLVGALIAVGVTAHSLGVFAAGADYLADAAAIAVSLFAIWLSGRPSTSRRPHGYARATTYAALVNAGWLFVLTVLVLAGAVDRLVSGAPHVDGLPVLVVSGIAAVVMISGAFILGGDDDDDGDLNVRAVWLDTVADGAAAAGVAVAGAVIFVRGGLFWLDPAVAGVIALVIAFHAARLLGEVVAELRRPVPRITGADGTGAGY